MLLRKCFEAKSDGQKLLQKSFGVNSDDTNGLRKSFGEDSCGQRRVRESFGVKSDENEVSYGVPENLCKDLLIPDDQPKIFFHSVIVRYIGTNDFHLPLPLSQIVRSL
jgi:hypothetical protein